jgi:site-specific DNA recombinase
MKPCFGYIRVSTQKQGEGVSLDAQKDAITGFASRNNLSVIKWFEEKQTAAKSGRPIFNAMLKLLRRGAATGLIMHKIDRSARNLKDWAAISDLSDAGIDVYFATESLDFRSRGGRLTADIQAVIAADYIRNLSQEARKGIHGRLKQGIYPFPAPIGYINHGSGKPKTLDPIRAPLVRKLFDLYLAGDHSIRTLHHKMADAGLTTRGNRPISRRSVENILQNPYYCGLMRNGRTGEVFPGVHETLISAKEFQRVAEIKSGRYTKKQTRHEHLLRRLFTCAACQGSLSPERQKGHVYYRCHTVGCPTKTVREERLDEAILNALLGFELSVSDHAHMEVDYESWKERQGFQSESRSLDLRVKSTEVRLDRLTDLYLDGKIGQNTHDRKHEQLLIELAKLKEDRVDMASRSASDRDRRKFFELMKSLAALYVSANPSEKRVLVENCFSNRQWNGKNVDLEPSILIHEVHSGLCVPYGGPIRDTIRTFLQILKKKVSSDKSKDAVRRNNFKLQHGNDPAHAA